MISHLVYIGVVAVITMRTMAVLSEHFVSDERSDTLSRFVQWFRFYKPGFSRTLGFIAAYLGTTAAFARSPAWTIGNYVFAFAAFTNFRKHPERSAYRVPREILQGEMGAFVGYLLFPLLLFCGIIVHFYRSSGGWHEIPGAPWEYAGAYTLALVFLSMKLGVWGAESHVSWAYLSGALAWDFLLLSGALRDGKSPFILLEGYALALDAFVLYLSKFKRR